MMTIELIPPEPGKRKWWAILEDQLGDGRWENGDTPREAINNALLAKLNEPEPTTQDQQLELFPYLHTLE